MTTDARRWAAAIRKGDDPEVVLLYAMSMAAESARFEQKLDVKRLTQERDHARSLACRLEEELAYYVTDSHDMAARAVVGGEVGIAPGPGGDRAERR